MLNNLPFKLDGLEFKPRPFLSSVAPFLSSLGKQTTGSLKVTTSCQRDLRTLMFSLFSMLLPD